MSEWINADDEIPAAKMNDREVSDDVLAYVVGHGGYVRMITVFYSHDEEDWYLDDGDALESGEQVTHWMPLPQPPTA